MARTTSATEGMAKNLASCGKERSNKSPGIATRTRITTKTAHRGKRKQVIPRPRPIHFNWRRHWAKKVAPHLQNEAVQTSLDFGMRLLDKCWQRGDPPYLIGRITGNDRYAVPGKLSWYRPFGRCHWIAFFSMAIGVINYPDLEWRFVSGDLHTVPVGYDQDGQPRVVMDILLFDYETAEKSIAMASVKTPTRGNWRRILRAFEQFMVPILQPSNLPRSSRSMREAAKTLKFFAGFTSR